MQSRAQSIASKKTSSPIRSPLTLRVTALRYYMLLDYLNIHRPSHVQLAAFHPSQSFTGLESNTSYNTAISLPHNPPCSATRWATMPVPIPKSLEGVRRAARSRTRALPANGVARGAESLHTGLRGEAAKGSAFTKQR